MARRAGLTLVGAAVFLAGWISYAHFRLPEATAQKSQGLEYGGRWQVVPASSGESTGASRGRFIIYNITTGESYQSDNTNNKWEAMPYPDNKLGGERHLPMGERKK